MKAFSTTFMAVLVIAALFWGNCFSCPQLLLAAQKHGCCPHTRSSKTECQTQGLKSFVKAETSTPPVIAMVAEVEVPPPSSEAAALESAPCVTSHAPPDALPLRI
jgi:hypothetical protein